jgi:hypothetical protein
MSEATSGAGSEAPAGRFAHADYFVSCAKTNSSPRSLFQFGKTMTTPNELKPTSKLLVMDILKSLGMDVSKWANMKGRAARAASNPKYCYNWSFSQLGEFVVVCLWHDGLKQKDGKLYYQLDRSRWRAKSTDTRRIEFLQHRKHRLDRARHWQHKQAGKRSG